MVATAPSGAKQARKTGIESLISGVDTWIFDLDDTLYPRSLGIYELMLARVVQYISNLVGVDIEDAHSIHNEYYEKYGSSMVGLARHHGASPEDILNYVHEVNLSAIDPNCYAGNAFSVFKGRRVVFTNGSREHAERVLRRLDINHHFDVIFSMESMNFVGKPDEYSYKILIEQHNIDPSKAIFFDDRQMNLEPARKFGMRTVLVAENASADESSIGNHGLVRCIPGFIKEMRQLSQQS